MFNKQYAPPKNWQDFELLCFDLWKAEWDSSNAKRNGRQGQAQHGVDICGQRRGEISWLGVQCKGKDAYKPSPLSEAEILAEIQKAEQFEPPLSEFTIATTGPKDSQIECTVRVLSEKRKSEGRFSVDVWAWSDIQDALRRHQAVARIHYPELNYTLVSKAGLDVALGRPLQQLVRQYRKHSAHADHRSALALLALGEQIEHPFLDRLFAGDPVQLGILKEVRAVFRAGPARKRNTIPVGGQPHLLTRARHMTLGLIAAFPFPMTVANLKRLIPTVAWDADIRYLATNRLISKKDDYLHVSKAIRRQVLASQDDHRAYVNEWISVLEPMQDYPDLAICLSLIYARNGERNKAVATLADVAHQVNPGMLNDLCCVGLVTLNTPKVHKRLPISLRLRLLNSAGLCLSRKGDHDKANALFQSLLTLSKRNKSNWGIGQAYINGGCALDASGDKRAAADWFRKAIAHARTHRDSFLLGRSLHDLAVTIGMDSPVEAIKLLQESRKAKIKAKDARGRLGYYMARGLAEVWRQSQSTSVKWFEKTIALASHQNDFYQLANAHLNLGTACLECKDYSRAIKSLRYAQRVAANEGFDAIRGHALFRLAMAYDRSARPQLGYKASLQAHSLFASLNDYENVVAALHGAGVCQTRLREFKKGCSLMRRAFQIAVKHNSDEWAYRCLRDIASVRAVDDKSRRRAATKLVAMAKQQADAKRTSLAARLANQAGQLRIELQEHDKAGHALALALHFIHRQSGHHAIRIHLLTAQFDWSWKRGLFEAALEHLTSVYAIANEAGDREWECRALDQHGTCLQQLGRFDEARKYHTSALKIARKVGLPGLIINCLNNLGELHRKLGMCSRAINLLQEAEDLAIHSSDVRSTISMAHNRSLALQQQGKFLQSQAVLERCLALAKKNRISGEVVRALHGLANLAWDQGEPTIAIRRYYKALATAKQLNNADHIALVSLNLARVLRAHGQAAEGLKVLLSIEATAFEEADAHLRSMELAELFNHVGRKADCLNQWRQAQRQGAAIGDKAVVFKASIEAAECLAEKCLCDDALESLEQALNASSCPEERGTVYTLQIRILAKAAREKECQAVIDEALAFAKKFDLPDHRLDYLIVIGDVQWDEAGSGRREAAKAYARALLEAFGSLPERLTGIAMHIVGKVNTLNGPERIDTLQDIQKHLVPFVASLLGKKMATQLGALALWPYRVADRLFDANRNHVSVTPEQAAEIYVEELLRA